MRLAAAVLTLAVVVSSTGIAAAPAPNAPRRVQLVAHDEAVRDVLLRLGDLAHLNVSVADDVKGNVNVSLHDATPDEAVRAVCSQLRLRCVREGRSLSVYTDSSVVIPLTIVPAARAARVVHGLYPRLAVTTDPSSNAVVLSGSATDIAAARTALSSLDVRDLSKPTTEPIMLKTQSASIVADRLRPLYPNAKITVVSKSTLLVNAIPPDLTQIKAIVAGLDAGTPAPTLLPTQSDAVKVLQRRPQDVARAVSAQIPRVRTSVSGTSVAITGSPDDVNRAKTLIAQLDVPAYGARYVQIYRIKNVDAKSVAQLIERSFPGVAVTVDASLNGLSVMATAADHQRIADGIARLDGTASSSGSGDPVAGGVAGTVAQTHEVIQLQSIVPNAGYGTSTSAQDIASAVQTSLQMSNPDLRVVVPNGTQQLIITGTAQSVRAAKELVAELDVPPMSVVLDTEILELDESSSRNLGLQLLTTSIGTTFTEVLPAPNAVTGQAGRLGAPQALTRTPFSFQAQVNLLIQNGKARVLADPRITTISGRTATIRAGDSISIITTIGGGSGTVATSQLQTFQTGVTLDITPIITSTGGISVALHPVVNSLTGYLNGVPQISTRDTQTSVRLRDNETLVIGGLIQESSQRTESKLPILGDLPLIGRAFRNQNATSTRNELIIVVTPHLLTNEATSTVPSAAQPPGMAIPSPKPLPTLPPNAAFPSPPPQPARTPAPRKATPAPNASPSGAPAASPAPAAFASPNATPSAFAQANVYVFGAPPTSTFAGPGDAPQIFYAMLQPTVVTPNTTVRISAITTTNVQRLTIGNGGTSIGLSPLGEGKWQGVFPANALSLPPTASTANLTLTAARGDGQSASIQIPVSLMKEQPVL